jgi:hypothetical protein
MATRTPTENHSATGANVPRGTDNMVARANEPGPSSPAERDRRLAGNGSRFLIVGLALMVVGAILYIALPSGTPSGIGGAVALIGSLPTVVGATMLGMAWVDRRSRAGKPFA